MPALRIVRIPQRDNTPQTRGLLDIGSAFVVSYGTKSKKSKGKSKKWKAGIKAERCKEVL
jgi:hypothetical protein